MELEARRFARRVLFIHFALFLLVISVVVIAAMKMRTGFRDQAIGQAKYNHELLAKQTALGIENYYESITGVMNLLQPADEQAATQSSAESTSAPLIRRAAPGTSLSPEQKRARRQALEAGPLSRLTGPLGQAHWASIQDKADLLFVVDPVEGLEVISVVGVNSGSPTPQMVVDAAREWLASVRQKAVSPFIRINGDAEGGSHLVVVPLRGRGGLLIVAVIPVLKLERDVLQAFNRGGGTRIALVDDSGTFISAGQRGMIGHVLQDLDDPRAREIARQYNSNRAAVSLVFDRFDRIGDVELPPGISTIQPANVLGRRWALIVSSDLLAVDELVRPIFWDALTWAAFLIVAVTLLLASTAGQLIRSQLRVERLQREVLGKEVAEAREIQLQWLPKDACTSSHINICATNQPATHISGDFYNWFELDDGRTVVTIGDVTGHGMAAAFLMATTQLLVRNIMPRVLDPAVCLRQINRQMLTQAFSGQFVTLLILVIDAQRGTMEVATAGHPPPLTGTSQAFEPLKLEPQLVLGVDSDTEYKTERFDLTPGQSLVLYTDGAVDAQRPDGERFSIEGLAASLYGKFDTAQSVLDTLRTSIDEFRQGRDLGDDLSLVAIQLQPQYAQDARKSASQTDDTAPSATPAIAPA